MPDINELKENEQTDDRSLDFTLSPDGNGDAFKIDLVTEISNIDMNHGIVRFSNDDMSLDVSKFTVDVAAPGRRTIEVTEDASNRALAELIVGKDAINEVISMLNSTKLLPMLFKRTVGTNRKFKAGNFAFNLHSALEGMAKASRAAGLKVSHDAINFMAALFLKELKPLKIVKPSRSVIILTNRTVRFPTPEMIREVLRADATEAALDVYTPGVATASRSAMYMQDSLVSDIRPRWRDLARRLRDTTRLMKYVNDTLYLIRAYVVADEQIAPAPEKMLNSTTLGALCENLTLVLAAFDPSITSTSSPDFDLDDAIQHFATVFAQSRRFETKQLVELASEIGHTVLLDSTQAPMFGVTYWNVMAEEGRAQASHLQKYDPMDTFVSQAPMHDVEARLNALLDPVFGALTPASVAALQVEQATGIVDELDAPVLSQILVDDYALVHYAAFLAEEVALSVDDDDIPRLAFKVSTAHLNYDGPGELGSSLITTDPRKVILFASKEDSSSTGRPPVQTIPDDKRDRYVDNPSGNLFRTLDRRVSLKPAIAGTKYKFDLRIARILGVEHMPGDVFITRAAMHEQIVATVLKSMTDFADWMKSEVGTDVLPEALRDYGHAVGSHIQIAYDNAPVHAIVRSLLWDVIQSPNIPRDERRRLRTHTRHKHMLFGMHLDVMLALLVRFGLVEYSVAQDFAKKVIHDTKAAHQLARSMK
jgi:hypothetical protein